MADPWLVSPKILKPTGRQFGVAHRVLDVPVPEISLQARVSWPLLASAKPQAWRSMCGWAGKPRPAASPARSTSLAKPACDERRAPLRREYERRLGLLLPLQLAQCPHFVAQDRMCRRRALLDPANVQNGAG